MTLNSPRLKITGSKLHLNSTTGILLHLSKIIYINKLIVKKKQTEKQISNDILIPEKQ